MGTWDVGPFDDATAADFYATRRSIATKDVTNTMRIKQPASWKREVSDVGDVSAWP
ncbi:MULTISPECIES: hypothetical protein [Streptomyces]|uniref:DUF4259 domain-containing protein n=1 Tax=Streptomyces lienomycini TaxID=284035 RepID=A0ABV9X5J9_9ACTN|nr:MULTISPECIES: hypothetical protein [Streptomyces]